VTAVRKQLRLHTLSPIDILSIEQHTQHRFMRRCLLRWHIISSTEEGKAANAFCEASFAWLSPGRSMRGLPVILVLSRSSESLINIWAKVFDRRDTALEAESSLFGRLFLCTSSVL